MPIFDQGYQHWQGALSGHGRRWLAITRHGVKAQLQNRFVRLLLLVSWLPAIALVSLLAFWGLLEQRSDTAIAVLGKLLPQEIVAKPEEYRTAVWTVFYSFFFKAELIASLFLVLIVGPNLVSRDLRFNALPLYLSRPVRRIDYFLGKLGIITYFIALTVIVPAVGAYLFGVAFSLGLGVVRDTFHLLGAGVLYGLTISICSGLVMLALSSLSRRSIYVGLAWAGFIFLSHMLSTVLIGIHSDTERRQIVQEGLNNWVKNHPPPPGIEMRGPYPIVRYPQTLRQLGPDGMPLEPPPDVRAREQWMREWSGALSELGYQAEAARAARARSDWRPTLSYASNLDRIGDWVLDTDGAWVTFGRAIARPQPMRGPALMQQPGEPSPERRLADRMVWQFPWYWSAAVLTGLCLFSAFVLSRRVKSLDRLK